MSLSWKNAKLPDGPREHVAMSAVGEGWFWIVYPSSSTHWKLQMIRGDLSEFPLPDYAYPSFEEATEAAQDYENRLLGVRSAMVEG